MANQKPGAWWKLATGHQEYRRPEVVEHEAEMQRRKVAAVKRSDNWGLVFGRHLVAMMVVALANPLIYYAPSPAVDWLATWFFPVAFAAVIYGLFLLFFTKRAKASGPKNFLILAWVLLALLVAEPWISRAQNAKVGSANRGVPAPQAELPWGQNDKPVN